MSDNLYPDKFAQPSDRVWRGARPTIGQAQLLAVSGVRSALNLEWEQEDNGLWPFGVLLYRIRDFEPLPSILPELADQHVIRALRYIRSAASVMYVHCRSGENRTGVIIAAYQLIELNQQLDQVLNEFQALGGIWQVPDMPYIRSLAARREYFLASI